MAIEYGQSQANWEEHPKVIKEDIIGIIGHHTGGCIDRIQGSSKAPILVVVKIQYHMLNGDKGSPQVTIAIGTRTAITK